MVASIVFAIIVALVVPPIARRVHRIPSAVGWVAAGIVLRCRIRRVVRAAGGPARSGCCERPRRRTPAGGERRHQSEAQLQRAHDGVDELVPRPDRWWRRRSSRPHCSCAICCAAARLYTLAGVALLGSGERGVPVEAEHLDRPDLRDAPVPLLRAPIVDLLAFGLVATLLRFVPKSIPRACRSSSRCSSGSAESGTRSRRSRRCRTSPSSAATCSRCADACTTLGKNAAVVLLQSPTGLHVRVGAAATARLVQRAGRGDARHRSRPRCRARDARGAVEGGRSEAVGGCRHARRDSRGRSRGERAPDTGRDESVPVAAGRWCSGPATTRPSSSRWRWPGNAPRSVACPGSVRPWSWSSDCWSSASRARSRPGSSSGRRAGSRPSRRRPSSTWTRRSTGSSSTFPTSSPRPSRPTTCAGSSTSSSSSSSAKGVTGQRLERAPARRRHRGRRRDRRLHRQPVGRDRRGVPPRAGARRRRDPARLPAGHRRRRRRRRPT